MDQERPDVPTDVPTDVPAAAPSMPPPGSDDEHPLDRRIVLVWRLGLVPALVPPALALGLLLSVLPTAVPAWMVALPAAVLAGLALGPLQTLRWRRWSWRLTDRAVELRSGVMTRRHVVLPHFRVQQIDVLEGPIERLLGLATLRVTSASAAGSVDLPGLTASIAPGLRSELLARVARANEELGRDGRDAV